MLEQSSDHRRANFGTVASCLLDDDGKGDPCPNSRIIPKIIPRIIPRITVGCRRSVAGKPGVVELLPGFAHLGGSRLQAVIASPFLDSPLPFQTP